MLRSRMTLVLEALEFSPSRLLTISAPHCLCFTVSASLSLLHCLCSTLCVVQAAIGGLESCIFQMQPAEPTYNYSLSCRGTPLMPLKGLQSGPLLGELQSSFENQAGDVWVCGHPSSHSHWYGHMHTANCCHVQLLCLLLFGHYCSYLTLCSTQLTLQLCHFPLCLCSIPNC